VPPDQERRPEDGHGEVVRLVAHRPELWIRRRRDVFGVRHLQTVLFSRETSEITIGQLMNLDYLVQFLLIVEITTVVTAQNVNQKKECFCFAI